jgi:GNAT superfamily N-acetyltransferase
VLARARCWVYSTLDAILLEKTLVDLPEPEAIEGVTFRLATVDDAAALRGLWGRGRNYLKTRQFRRRLADGCMCFAAFRDDRVVAIAWVAQRDVDGHVATVRPDSLVGMDVFRRPGEGGHGLGRALLAYSSIVVRDAGYRSKVAYVAATNAPMLATMRPLGYTEIGRARRRIVLGRVTWSWELGDDVGRGSFLTIR